jgi:quinol monooxygenase YgiN
MRAQLRLYTINRGEMDAFLKHFQEEILPAHQKAGFPVVATFVNRPQNEFIWLRSYTDEADRDTKQKAFQQACAEAGIKLGLNVAKMEIREVETAFAVAVTA